MIEKYEIVRELKIRGLNRKYILKRPKRVLIMLAEKFRLFDYGVNKTKGRKYA